jgi:hypothetical protein
MRLINVHVELYNDTEIINELDHIARLIQQGYVRGEGWSIEGEVEKEIITNEDEHEEDEPTENI